MELRQRKGILKLSGRYVARVQVGTGWMCEQLYQVDVLLREHLVCISEGGGAGGGAESDCNIAVEVALVREI